MLRWVFCSSLLFSQTNITRWTTVCHVIVHMSVKGIYMHSLRVVELHSMLRLEIFLHSSSPSRMMDKVLVSILPCQHKYTIRLRAFQINDMFCFIANQMRMAVLYGTINDKINNEFEVRFFRCCVIKNTWSLKWMFYVGHERQWNRKKRERERNAKFVCTCSLSYDYDCLHKCR